MPPRARRSPSAPLCTMSHMFPARRRYGASPVSAVRRAQYPSTASARRYVGGGGIALAEGPRPRQLSQCRRRRTERAAQ
eukprot:994426-Alexandrium_andersonii.AAC.1